MRNDNVLQQSLLISTQVDDTAFPDWFMLQPYDVQVARSKLFVSEHRDLASTSMGLRPGRGPHGYPHEYPDLQQGRLLATHPRKRRTCFSMGWPLDLHGGGEVGRTIWFRPRVLEFSREEAASVSPVRVLLLQSRQGQREGGQTWPAYDTAYDGGP